MITSRGICTHSNGKTLSTCGKYPVYSLSDCAADCTASNSCVGYSYGYYYCDIYPSSLSFSTCLTNYTLYNVTWSALADTSDDLVAYNDSMSNMQCYAKNKGINNL